MTTKRRTKRRARSRTPAAPPVPLEAVFDEDIPGPGPLDNWAWERFCLEFIQCNNATMAADRAGYSSRSAGQIGHRLLKSDEIRARITQLRLERSARLRIDADRVLEEYAAVALATMADFVDVAAGLASATLTDEEKKMLEGLRTASEEKGFWPFRKLSDITPLALRAVAEFSDKGEGGRSLKLHSKLDALNKIAEHIKFFPPKEMLVKNRGGTAPPPPMGMTDEARFRALIEILHGAFDRKKMKREDRE